VAAGSRTPSRPGGGAAPPAPPRRIRRTAWLLGLIAVVVYIGFIAATALRS
jgi:hypothetical protein